MRAAEIRKALKPWMLPIAMLIGIVAHNYIGYVAFLSPYLIFVMLLITYCRVSLRDFHTGGFIGWLLLAQIVGSVVLYLIMAPFNTLLAQAAFICVFCPTATAAPVVTGMLGGSVSRVATYSVFSYVAVAFLAPLLLSWMNPGQQIPFIDTLLQICRTVLPLILGPLVIALLLERIQPHVHHAIANHQSLSFYIWAVALIIVVGNSVSFVMREPASEIPTMIAMAVISLLVCVFQFSVGRIIGRRYGDPISASQSLGQKNTVLVIWLAMTYLNPIVSVAPAAYVAWHNIINSYQIIRHERHRNA